jgi:hypothetical protein
VLDEVEERLLRPLEIVEHDDERLFRCRTLEQPSERELRFRRGRAEDRIRLRSELQHDLDERPVGDPFAVGEAARANGSRVGRLDKVQDEARLADACRAEQGEQLARPLRDHVLEVRAQPLALASPAHERGVEAARDALRRRVDLEEAVRGDRRRFPLRSSGGTFSTPTASRTSRNVSIPIKTSPGPAACSSRAATLTASP